MIVEVPVLGKINVPDGMSGDEVMRIVGEYAGVDTTKPISDWDAFTRALERGVTGTTRGVGQVMTKTTGLERTAPAEDIVYDPMGGVAIGGTTPSVQEQRTGESVKQADMRKEFEYELAKLQGSKAASYGGYIAGTLLDPANMITGLGTPTMKSIVAEGVLTGGVQGFFDPLYGSEDTWGNRAFGAGVGATGGGIIGAGLGKLFGVGKGLPTDKATGDINKFISEEGKTLDDLNKAPDGDVTSTPTTLNNPTVVQTATDPTQIELPKLPQFLGGAKPSFFKSAIEFEQDLDKALYIIGNPKSKSASHQEYVKFVMDALGVDEATAMKLGAQVRQEVIDKSKLVQKIAGLEGKQADKVPFSMSQALDKFINPVDKYLDDFSKMVYNYGQGLTEVNGKLKVNLSKAEQDYSFQKIKQAYENEGVKLTPYDIATHIKGYQKMLDELKNIEGPKFKPKSYEEYVKGGMGFDEHIALLNNGAFDGCVL